MNFDAAGQLTSRVDDPSGLNLTTSYTYDTAGNVLTATSPGGNVITYTYDANGNRTLERDAAGNTVTRTFGSANQLLTETRYLVPDPDGSGAGVATVPQITRFIYDSELHLRFVVSPEGRVR